jgi:hypothetical protein
MRWLSSIGIIIGVRGSEMCVFGGYARAKETGLDGDEDAGEVSYGGSQSSAHLLYCIDESTGGAPAAFITIPFYYVQQSMCITHFVHPLPYLIYSILLANYTLQWFKIYSDHDIPRCRIDLDYLVKHPTTDRPHVAYFSFNPLLPQSHACLAVY